MEESNATPESVVGSFEASPDIPPAKKSAISRFRSLGTPRAYLAEYAVLLIVVGCLLGLSISFFGSIVDHIGSNKPTARFGGGWTYTASIASLAAAAVLLPLLAIFTRRTGKSEEDTPTVKNTGWRKAFLSVFLVVVVLNGIGYSIAFTFEVFSRLASIGLATGDKPVVWKPLLKHGFAVVLFVFTAWLYARDYRAGAETDELHSRWSRVHRYALVFIISLLAIVFMFVPLSAQRNIFIDNAIENDLRDIRSKITSYESKEGRLPDSLDDLELEDGIEARAERYDYEYNKKGTNGYEICAVFKTSTENQEKRSGNVLDQYLSGGMSYYPPSGDDPGVHSKGRDCFNYEGTSYRNPYLYLNDSYNGLNSNPVTTTPSSFD